MVRTTPLPRMTSSGATWLPVAEVQRLSSSGAYIESLVDLLPTYAFLDIDGTRVTAADVDPSLSNTFLLDLNPAGDPNAFVDLLVNGGTMTAVFGDQLKMVEGLVQRTGLSLSIGTPDLLVGLEELVGHLPSTGETWYEPFHARESGDGTVPTVSSAENFRHDSGRLDNGSLALRDMDATAHEALAYTVDSQMAILQAVGLTDVEEGDISTSLHDEDIPSVLSHLVQLLIGELLVDDRDPSNVKVYAAFLGNNLELESDSTTGIITIRDLDDDDDLTMVAPQESLTIYLGIGDDVLQVATPSTFDTDLNIKRIISNRVGDVPIIGDLFSLIGSSQVEFLATVNLPGHDLDVAADKITVDGATISTRDVDEQDPQVSVDDSGHIDFQAQEIVLQPGAALLAHVGDGDYAAGHIVLNADDRAYRDGALILPVDSNKNVATVTITDAQILGGDVSVKAIAEDKSLYDDLGAYSDLAVEDIYQVLDQVTGIGISRVLGISGQFVKRSARAEVSITGSTVTGAGSVAVESTADADASLHTVSVSGLATAGYFTLAIGYGEAHSTATTEINTTTIVAGDAVDISSNATTKAFVKARTHKAADAPNNPNNVSLAIAVANTSETSHVTVSQGSSVTSLNEGVNIDAMGKVTNFAWSQPEIDDDGITAVAFAIDMDTADILSRVDGTIKAAGGVGNTFDARNGKDVDYGANTIRIPDHGFVDGQEVSYSHGVTDAALGKVEPPDIVGLDDGESYYVQRVDKDTIQLSEAPTIDIGVSQLRPEGDPQHSLGRPDRIEFLSENVNTESGHETITFASPHGLQDGQAVTYLGTFSNPDQEGNEQNAGVGGLEQGKTYYVITIAGNESAVQLAESPNGLAIDLTDAGVGEHAFLCESDVVTFAPTNAVDNAANTIAFDEPHGFNTGDAVIYRTDPTGTRRNSLAGRVVTEFDAPIDGLRDGTVYYVGKVDDQTIRLAATMAAAANAAAIDLKPAVDLLGTGLGDAHTLKSSNSPDGISVHAGLDATNAINANAEIEYDDEPVPAWAEFLGEADRTFLQAESLILSPLAQVKDWILNKQPEESPTQAGTNFGVAGAIAVNYADHTVEAIIGETGQLTCDKDISVAADISQASQVASVSGVSKPKDSEASVAIALGLGMFNNTAKATVESNAQLTADRTVTVSSNVDYGFLIANPLSPINPLDYLKNSGPEGFAYFMDGTLGYASNLFNTFVMTSASQSKVGVGASFAINIYDNTSKATIGSDAVVTGKHSVDVNADIEMNLIGVVGVGGLSLNLEGGYRAYQEIKKAVATKDKILGGVKELVNPFGAEGDEGGIGASFLVEVASNTSEAVIQSGAKVNAGGGGLDVNACTDIFDFALAQAGSNASSLAVAGAVSVDVVNNTTLAHIDAGAVVNVINDGAITISATDDLTRVGITGGVVAGANYGVGVSVSVNVVIRDTQAFIGEAFDASPGDAGTKINAVGPITLEAISTGAPGRLQSQVR